MRQTLVRLAFFSLLAGLMQPADVDAQQVGDTVICIKDAPLKRGNENVGTFGFAQVSTVEAINGDWFWISSQGTPAWVQKRNVLLLDQAIPYFTEEIRKNPNYQAAYFARGTARWMKDELDAALTDFDAAIRLNPRDAAAYNNRANIWGAKGEHDKAIADFNEALRLKPNAITFHARGVVREIKADYDNAIADFNEALRLNGQYALAYAERGWCWLAKGEWDKALSDFNETLRLDANSYIAYAFLSALRSSCPDEKYRDAKKAVVHATRACELTGWKDMLALNALAAAYAEQGDFDRAVEYQTKALDLRKVAPKAGEKDVYRDRLELYKQKMPYRVEVAAK